MNMTLLRLCTAVIRMPYNPFRPLSPSRPHEVAAALRARAAKIDDDTTAGYLRLAAETIETNTGLDPRKKK